MDKNTSDAVDNVMLENLTATHNPNPEQSTKQQVPDDEIAMLSKAILKKDRKITELEQRLNRLEKRLKSNERFAHTFASCMDTQVIAIDAVTKVVRRALKTDSETAADLAAAIREYDDHKIRRFISGSFGVILWIASVAAAAFVGALIYWTFSV